jgi:hypothetical protein
VIVRPSDYRARLPVSFRVFDRRPLESSTPAAHSPHMAAQRRNWGSASGRSASRCAAFAIWCTVIVHNTPHCVRCNVIDRREDR